MGYYKKSHPHRDLRRHARKTACRKSPWEDAETPDPCPCCDKRLPAGRDICPACEAQRRDESDHAMRNPE